MWNLRNSPLLAVTHSHFLVVLLLLLLMWHSVTLGCVSRSVWNSITTEIFRDGIGVIRGNVMESGFDRCWFVRIWLVMF